MAVRSSRASSGVRGGSCMPMNSEKDGTLFKPSLKYVGLLRVGASELDVEVVEVGIAGSGSAVARQREVVEGPKETLFEISRNGGAFKQRNRLTAAILSNPRAASSR